MPIVVHHLILIGDLKWYVRRHLLIDAKVPILQKLVYWLEICPQFSLIWLFLTQILAANSGIEVEIHSIADFVGVFFIDFLFGKVLVAADPPTTMLRIKNMLMANRLGPRHIIYAVLFLFQT